MLIAQGRVAKESNSLARDVSASKQAPAPKVHWSALEPLSANEVSGNEGDYDMVNGADGGMLDEEAERKAFQEAVMAWRSGGETTEKGGKSLSLTGYGQTEEGSGDNGMWSNPFGGGGGEMQAVSSEVGLGVGEGDVVLVSARGQRPSDDGQIGRGGKGSGHGGKKLGDGVLDEEREQAVSVIVSLSMKYMLTILQSRLYCSRNIRNSARLWKPGVRGSRRKLEPSRWLRSSQRIWTANCRCRPRSCKRTNQTCGTKSMR